MLLGLEGKKNRLIEDTAAVNWCRPAESKEGPRDEKNHLNCAPDKDNDYESTRGRRLQFPRKSCILQMTEFYGRSHGGRGPVVNRLF